MSLAPSSRPSGPSPAEPWSPAPAPTDSHQSPLGWLLNDDRNAQRNCSSAVRYIDRYRVSAGRCRWALLTDAPTESEQACPGKPGCCHQQQAREPLTSALPCGLPDSTDAARESQRQQNHRYKNLWDEGRPWAIAQRSRRCSRRAYRQCGSLHRGRRDRQAGWRERAGDLRRQRSAREVYRPGKSACRRQRDYRTSR